MRYTLVFSVPWAPVATAHRLLGAPLEQRADLRAPPGSSFMWVKEGSRLTFSLSRVLEYPVCIALCLARGTLTFDLELNDQELGAVVRAHYDLSLSRTVYSLKRHRTHLGGRCYHFYFLINNMELRE